MQIASLTLLLTGPVSWSITCGFSKSRECWLKMACSAAADMSKRPFLTYDACSLARLSAVRPVSPIYTFSQSLHFRRYTTPAWSFRFERSLMACCRDHFHGAGLPTTRTSSGFSTLCIGCETPSTNGITTVVSFLRSRSIVGKRRRLGLPSAAYGELETSGDETQGVVIGEELLCGSPELFLLLYMFLFCDNRFCAIEQRVRGTAFRADWMVWCEIQVATGVRWLAVDR